MKAKVYKSIDGNLSTSKRANPWATKHRGAVKFGEHDYVLWDRGSPVNIIGKLTLGGHSEAEARAWVESGKLPGVRDPKPRKRHSRDGSVRCPICAPLRCVKAR